MNANTGDLKRKILQKNIMLDSLMKDKNTGEDRVLQVKAELDSLLYQYFKSLRCN